MTADGLAERITEIQARLEAATPGKWISATDNGRKTGIALVGTVAQRGTGECIAVLGGAGGRRGADAELIAFAPADLAFLLAQLAEKDAAMDAIAEVLGVYDSEETLAQGVAGVLNAAETTIREKDAEIARLIRAHESAQTAWKAVREREDALISEIAAASAGASPGEPETPTEPALDLLGALQRSLQRAAKKTGGEQ